MILLQYSRKKHFFLHLLVIASDLGISPIGVRDFGLAFATLALALQGEDKWCVMYKGEKTAA